MASTKHIRDGKAAKGAAPISAHPGFPLVVALWFAALLGLGSLILPVALIERLVMATGIADLVPAAAPPLGFTARAAIALGGTVLGAVLGLYAARKIARPAAEAQRRRSIKGADSRRQPLSAHEDLGSEGFDSVAGFATARRRALASEEEGRTSDFLVVTPHPGKRPERGFDYAQSARDEPLELGELAEFTEDQEIDLHSAPSEEEFAMSQIQVFSPIPVEPASGDPLPFSPPSMARRPAPDEQAEEIEMATFEDDAPEAPTPPDAEPEQQFFISQSTAEQPELQQEPVAELGLVELVEKLGATLEKHREWSAQRHEQQADAPRFPRAVVMQDFADPQLAEAEFGVADPAEAAQAMAAFFSAPEPDEHDAAALPAEMAERQEFIAVPVVEPVAARQLRPFAGLGRVDDGDDDEDEDIDQIAASFSLPIGRAAAPVAAEPETTPEEGEAAESESYSSLLVMKNPFRDHRPEFVRIEEPEPDIDEPQPAVVFPHEVPGSSRMFDRPATQAAPAAPAMAPAAAPAPFSNEDNDRVLREALMNLQRIGKN